MRALRSVMGKRLGRAVAASKPLMGPASPPQISSKRAVARSVAAACRAKSTPRS